MFFLNIDMKTVNGVRIEKYSAGDFVKRAPPKKNPDIMERSNRMYLIARSKNIKNHIPIAVSVASTSAILSKNIMNGLTAYNKDATKLTFFDLKRI